MSDLLLITDLTIYGSIVLIRYNNAALRLYCILLAYFATINRAANVIMVESIRITICFQVFRWQETDAPGTVEDM